MRRARFAPSGPLALDPKAFGLEFFFGDEPKRGPKLVGDVAVIEVIGPLMHHGDSWWRESYDAIKSRVGEALASDAKCVLLSIDSPGGLVAGCFDTVREIRAMAAAREKPIYAYVDGEALSGGCALACAAEKIFLPDSGMMGSIGVIASPVDCTQADAQWGVRFHVVSSGIRKADGNPHTPMTDEALASIQATVDAQAAVFFQLVAETRGLSSEAVRKFEGRTFVGQAAVDAGLADGIASYDQVLAMVASGTLTSAEAAKGNTDMGMKEVRDSLAKMAEGEGEEAEKAKKALKALDEGDEKKDGDKKDEKAEGSDEKKDDKAEGSDEKKDGDKKDEAKAAAGALALRAGQPTILPTAKAEGLELAARVQTIEAELATEKEQKERGTLLSSRPDFAAAVVDFLNGQSIEVVRKACQPPAKGGLPLGPGRPNLAAAAQPDVAPTLGQGDGGGFLPPPGTPGAVSERELLAERMGLRTAAVAPTFDGFNYSMPSMTREQARDFLAKKGQGK